MMNATKTRSDQTTGIDFEQLQNNGPFVPSDRKVVVFSMGAANENHGSALPSNIDDLMAKYITVNTANRGGYTYAGHIPYSTDRVSVAIDWNPNYISPELMVNRTSAFITSTLYELKKGSGIEATHVVMASAHGGNSALIGMEDQISQNIGGLPVLYLPPFPKEACFEYGGKRVFVSHADSGEHSVALSLGLLDKMKLDIINEIARKDPMEAIIRNKPIVGLAYYRLPISGPRFEELRVMTRKNGYADGVPPVTKSFLAGEKIEAIREVGERLVSNTVNVYFEKIEELRRTLLPDKAN